MARVSPKGLSPTGYWSRLLTDLQKTPETRIGRRVEGKVSVSAQIRWATVSLHLTACLHLLVRPDAQVDERQNE